MYMATTPRTQTIEVESRNIAMSEITYLPTNLYPIGNKEEKKNNTRPFQLVNQSRLDSNNSIVLYKIWTKTIRTRTKSETVMYIPALQRMHAVLQDQEINQARYGLLSFFLKTNRRKREIERGGNEKKGKEEYPAHPKRDALVESVYRVSPRCIQPSKQPTNI